MSRLLPLVLLVLLAGIAGMSLPISGVAYRDLAVYTTSSPDPENTGGIIARSQFVNRSNKAFTINASLNRPKTLTLSSTSFSARIDGGKSAIWIWKFSVPAGFTREILHGAIKLNGVAERYLFLTVQAADPPDYQDAGQDRINDKAQVVATYTPRLRSSILAELKNRQRSKTRMAFTLASRGKSRYKIVIDTILPAPPPSQEALSYWKDEKLTTSERALVTALADLQRCITLKSGASLSIATKATTPAIHVRLRPVNSNRQYDVYRLRTVGKDLFIEANNVEGLRNGIYGLLTDHLDCHWFQPKGLGEEVVLPQDRTVRIPALDEVNGSDWYSSMGVSWGSEGVWDHRLRAITNRGRMNFGHSWAGYIGKGEYPYEKYPEYYARDRDGKIRLFDNGWSATNFCSTNPEVLDIVAKKVNAYFNANPDAPVCSIDPNDYGRMCLCDRCLALDKQYGQLGEEGTDVSDRMLHFSAEIHKRLDPQFKDKYLGILVYGFQIEMPKSAKPHAHHAGTICNMAWIYDHTRPWNDPTSQRNRHFYDLVKGWGALLKQYGYYDYYGHWDMFGPWAMVSKMREDLAAFHDQGGTFLVLECQPNFAAQGLNDYIAGRLSWDVHANVDLLLEDFFTCYYGPAADAMRNYWLTAERFYNLERPGISNPPRVCLRPEFWNDLDLYLRQARAITAKLPPAQRHFADRVTIAADGFEFGRLLFRYDLYFGAHAKTFGKTIDHAAAVQYLQTHRARMEEIVKKYPTGDPYWPMLIPSYLVPNFTQIQQGHEEAAKTQKPFTRPTTFEF